MDAGIFGARGRVGGGWAGGYRFERVADHIRQDQTDDSGSIRQTHQPTAFYSLQPAAQEVDFVNGSATRQQSRGESLQVIQ